MDHWLYNLSEVVIEGPEVDIYKSIKKRGVADRREFYTEERKSVCTER